MTMHLQYIYDNIVKRVKTWILSRGVGVEVDHRESPKNSDSNTMNKSGTRKSKKCSKGRNVLYPTETFLHN